jgi:hypothetical protein
MEADMNTLSRPTRRQLLALGAGSCIASVGSFAAATTARRPIVIELFTSQGCSSCPPADAFLEELRSMKGVVAISLHVDYWDYLGWRDTLGDAAYSQRQRDYARRRNDGDVYTPQMVIDGANHFVGSNRTSVRAAIKRAQAATPPLWIPITLSNSGEELVVVLDAHDNAPESTLWLLAIAPSVTVKIMRGENAGRKITYFNVVKRLVPAGMWHGKAVSLSFPVDGFMTDEGKACVALLQSGTAGPVIGAATWGSIAA